MAQLLHGLVADCATKFRSEGSQIYPSCNREWLTEYLVFQHHSAVTQIKFMAHDPLTDEAIKKKLVAVFAYWHMQFTDDSKMSNVANLWTRCGGGVKVSIRPFGTRIFADGLARVEAADITSITTI